MNIVVDVGVPARHPVPQNGTFMQGDCGIVASGERLAVDVPVLARRGGLADWQRRPPAGCFSGDDAKTLARRKIRARACCLASSWQPVR